MISWNCTVGSKEEKFRLSIKVSEAFLDSRALARDEKVQNGVNIFFKAEPGGCTQTR